MLQCLIEVAQYPVAVWRPENVQEPIGPEIIIATGAQTIPNFLIKRTER